MAMRWLSCGRRRSKAASTEAGDADDDPDVYMDDPDVYAPVLSKTATTGSSSPSKAAKKTEDEKENKAPEQKKWTGGPKVAEEDGEVAMLKGNTYMLREEWEEAEAAFEHSLKLQPSLLEAHFGRINAMRKQGKFMRAFSCCREGKKATGNDELMDLQKIVQQEYQNQKKKDKVKKEKAYARAAKDVDKMMKEEENQHGCPSSSGPLGDEAPLTQMNATYEEREDWKNEVLAIYRKLYEKYGCNSDGISETVASYDDALKMGLQITDGHRPMPRPKDVPLPKDFRRSVGTLTLDKLKEFNYTSDRLLLSVYGDIFDVSDRPDKYGRIGPYWYFAGCDISWGLASGQDTADDVNKFYDIWKLPSEDRDKKLQILCSWIGFYEKEYGDPVGKLEVFYNERNLAMPPTSEECVVM